MLARYRAHDLHDTVVLDAGRWTYTRRIVPRRIHVFSDEAGDLTFKPAGNGVSRYFMIGTVALADCAVGEELLRLRRELAWAGVQLDQFHATSDKQRVRDRVFDVLARSDVRFDVTILDKRMAFEYLRADPLRFYKTAWYLHFKYVAPRIVGSLDELLVVASSLQINKKKKLVHLAVSDVVAQVSPTVVYHTAFAQAMSDPCLQAADYITWAVQREYESGDSRSYDLIRHLIESEFEPWEGGSPLY